LIEKIFWIAKGTYLESLQFEQATDGFAHRWIVVNDIAYLLGRSHSRSHYHTTYNERALLPPAAIEKNAA
jgi:hypothetical protein